MKFPGDVNVEEYTKALKLGAVKGASFGFGLSALGFVYLKRRTGFFNYAGGFHRLLLFVAPATLFAVVQMERQSRVYEEFERDRQQGLKPREMTQPSADLWDRINDYVKTNKYKFVVGGWAASMVASFWAVNRDKYMSKSQKIVQARVYAQGLTVLMLLGTVFLSVTEPKNDKQKALEQSKSWERDLLYVESANRKEKPIVEKLDIKKETKEE